MGGPRGTGCPNQQGLLIKDLIDRCSLHILSLCERSRGPSYTFWNSTSETTIDYIIGDADTSSSMVHCFTHEVADINTSDHLPITAVFNLPNTSSSTPVADMGQKKINWAQAMKSPKMSVYKDSVTALINPLLGRSYENIDEINNEISEVLRSIFEISLSTLPIVVNKRGKQRIWYDDEMLAVLAKKKKLAWDEWKFAGRPLWGPLYEKKNKTQKEFKFFLCCQCRETKTAKD